MSNSVDRAGSFRFDKVLESGVSLTKNKFPSFNVRLRLSEYFDEDERVWVDWSSAEVEISAYFSLFGKNGKTGTVEPILNHAQIMKIFGWDGRSFTQLAKADYSEVKGQIRVTENDPEYAARNPYQISWIDTFDADPARQLRKLEDDELSKLDSDWALVLKQSGKAPTAASLKGKKEGPKPPAKTAAVPPATKKEVAPPTNDAPLTKDQKKAALKAKSARLKAAAEKVAPITKKGGPAPPARSKAVPEPEPEDDVTESSDDDGGKQYTKQEAWEIVVEMKADAVTDEQLNEAWNCAVEDIAGDVDDADVTPQQWASIVDAVLDTEYEAGKTIGKF